MSHRILPQYSGVLTTFQIAAGMNAATANAARLAADANLFYEAGRYPSAASLAILSLEEQGKLSILRELATATSIDHAAQVWRRYRRHTEKNYLALMPAIFAKGGRLLTAFRSLFFDESANDRLTYDIVKQLGFYTDCCGNAHWSIPVEVIDRNLSNSLVSLANALSRGKPEITERELELWVCHLQGGLSRDSLCRWAAAIVSEGFKEPEYEDLMRQFTEGL
jgi:AbiV family abortive infection protein